MLFLALAFLRDLYFYETQFCKRFTETVAFNIRCRAFLAFFLLKNDSIVVVLFVDFTRG